MRGMPAVCRRPKPTSPRSGGAANALFPAALVVAFAAWALGDAEAADISLPELLAVELPSYGMTDIADSESPMAGLLASADAGGLAVTHDRAGFLFPVGGTEVAWTAWDGEPYASGIAAAATAYVYVFRHGETPVGVTADDRATAGNHSANVVRDGSGTVHVAWLDSGRAGAGDRVMYRRGVQDEAMGVVTWEADPVRVSNGTGESSRSHVAMAASDGAVHFAWYEDSTNWYRRLVRTGAAPAYVWTFEDPVDLAVSGSMSDNGPDICAVSDAEVYVLWNRRSELFPSLTFCDNARDHLVRLRSGEPLLRAIVKKLTALHDYCRGWFGAFRLDALPFRVTPESESTLSKFRRSRTLECPDGQTRVFSLHMRLTPRAWRIHICPDNDTMYVGYIGPHLPTSEYRS